MGTHEKYLQYAKVVLLYAILCCCVWAIGTKTAATVHAQLGGTSGFAFKHISTATNTQEASATVILHTITINGGTAGAITVKDTAAADCSGGTTIAVIATLAGASSQTLAYDL
jgi:hypothetical protein